MSDEDGIWLQPASGLGESWWATKSEGFTLELANLSPGTYRLETDTVWLVYWEQEFPNATAPVVSARLDSTDLDAFEITSTSFASPTHLSWEFQASTDLHEIEVAGDWFAQAADAPDDAVVFSAFSLTGPLEDPESGVSESRSAVLLCEPEPGDSFTPCASNILEDFTTRAWRRPPDDASLAGLLELVSASEEAGSSFESAISTAMEAVLLSPRFLYRVEEVEPGSVRALDPYEIASRLSYLAWKSMPDETLFECAQTGGFQEDSTPECAISAQLERLLSDPRAASVVEDFGGGWLQLDALGGLAKDGYSYPEFDTSLIDSMQTETLLFLEEVLLGDANLGELWDANYTWIDEDLADLYAMPSPTTAGFSRVDVDPEIRGGLLRQASLLSLTAHATRTSPSRRGSWVLSEALCENIGEPAEDFSDSVFEADGANTREVLEAHASDPACSGCHTRMDPLGFALENYDPIGRWRDDLGGVHIDAAATTFDGIDLAGPKDLVDYITTDERMPTCMVERLFTFSNERPPTAEDSAAMTALNALAITDGFHSAAVVAGNGRTSELSVSTRPRGGPMSRIIRPSRRGFLSGAGACVLLPWLESVPAMASTTHPRRLVIFYVPNGMYPSDFAPTGTGTNFQLSQILSPLEAQREEILILSGLTNNAATPETLLADPHGSCSGSFLTAEDALETEETLNGGMSMDQVIADAIGHETFLPSLELGSESYGFCNPAQLCTTQQSVSYRASGSPIPFELNPRGVFRRLFGSSSWGETDTARQAEVGRRQGVLDFIKADTARLETTLGAADKIRLDDYLTGIEEIERKLYLQNNHSGSCAAAITNMEQALSISEALDTTEHAHTMCDLITLALQCDMTRVVTYMLGYEGSNRVYPWLGVNEGHHYLSHHGGGAEKLADIATIGQWEVEQFSYLLNKLASTQEGNGSLLDNTIVLFCSGLGDPQPHSGLDLPIVLAGKGAGAITPGRHVQFQEEPVANLFISLMQSMGADIESFGSDGTSTLAGLS